MKVRPPQLITLSFKVSVVTLLIVLVKTHLAQGQCSLGCLPGPIEIAIGSEGETKLLPEYFIAFESSECDGVNTVTIVETGSDTVDCSMVGQRYVVRVLNNNSGNFCTTEISVVDNIVPLIECPKDLSIHCDEDYRDTSLTGVPLVTENCEGQISYSDNLNALNDCGLGEVTRTWRVEDPSGHTATCVQAITIQDTIAPTVQFPPDITIYCGQDPLDLSLTGSPIYSDNCGSLDDGYTDLSFELCSPGTKRILRNWSVVDFCNTNGPNGQFSHAQTIVVRDTVRPTFVCPAKDSVSTDPLSSTAIYAPMSPDSLYDNCSGTIYHFLAFDENGDSLTAISNEVELPIGENIIKHFVRDSCGNADSCEQVVKVYDDEDPQVVCFPSLQFSLGAEMIYVYPEQFYRDASDNVTPDSLLKIDFRRDTSWSDSLVLDCSDVSDNPLVIQLRVTDAFGNFNLCDVQVFVVDISVPTISCPPNLTLDCAANLDSTAVPQIWDNCSWELTHRDDLSGLNPCGFGMVSRTWIVEDASGNRDSCKQFIELLFTGQPQFTEPADVTIACGEDTSPSVTGEPLFTDDCSQLIYAYEDRSFSGGGNYVEIIRRTFEVGDLCRPSFSVEFEQRIYVEDNGSPSLDCQVDSAYYLYHDSCDVLVEIPLGLSDNCSSSFEFSHTAPFGSIENNKFTAELAKGSYDFFVIVTDESGNADQCRLQFDVVDTISPMPICRSGLSFTLPDSGTIYPPAQLFDVGSSDNCTSKDDLSFQLYPSRFDCFDLGLNEVQVIVSDASGNSSICRTEVFLSDPEENCQPIKHDLAGMILDAHGFHPLASQAVELIIDGDTSIVWTDSTGWYQIRDVPHGAELRINPTIRTDLQSGLSTADIVILQRHLLERRNLQSPAEFLAADVNESGSLSNLDALFIRRAILQTLSGFPGKDLLRSMNYEYRSDGGQDVMQLADEEEMYIIASTIEDRDDLHFLVTKKGDLNGSYALEYDLSSRSQTDSSFVMTTVEKELVPQGRASLFIRSNRAINLAGLQFGIDFEAQDLAFIEFTNSSTVQLQASDYNLIEDQGRLLVSWTSSEDVVIQPGDTILELLFQSKAQQSWPSGLDLSEDIASEVVSGDFEVFDICRNIRTYVDNSESEASVPQWQIAPNPFTEAFELKGKVPDHIEVFDFTGRKVFEKDCESQKALRINTQTWAPGIYLLVFRVGSSKQFRKLVKK